MEKFSFILIVSKAEEEQQKKLFTMDEVIDVVCHEGVYKSFNYEATR